MTSRIQRIRGAGSLAKKRTGGSILSIQMFIPHAIDIESRPDLRVFPVNVLFAKPGIKEGVEVMGRAIYEPELSSFRIEGCRVSLRYQNRDGGDCWLRITFDKDAGEWEGEKVINGQLTGSASGPEWDVFFCQFSLLGLANGERCLMTSLSEAIRIR